MGASLTTSSVAADTFFTISRDGKRTENFQRNEGRNRRIQGQFEKGRHCRKEHASERSRYPNGKGKGGRRNRPAEGIEHALGLHFMPKFDTFIWQNKNKVI